MFDLFGVDDCLSIEIRQMTNEPNWPSIYSGAENHTVPLKLRPYKTCAECRVRVARYNAEAVAERRLKAKLYGWDRR